MEASSERVAEAGAGGKFIRLLQRVPLLKALAQNPLLKALAQNPLLKALAQNPLLKALAPDNQVATNKVRVKWREGVGGGAGGPLGR